MVRLELPANANVKIGQRPEGLLHPDEIRHLKCTDKLLDRCRVQLKQLDQHSDVVTFRVLEILDKSLRADPAERNLGGAIDCLMQYVDMAHRG